jgi:hypothetical protein
MATPDGKQQSVRRRKWSVSSLDGSAAQARLRPPRFRVLRLEGLESRQMLAAELVSASISGGSGNTSSGNQQISDDGRFVVFQSNATNLVAGDNNQPTITDIFRRDLVTGQTVLVSMATTALGANNSSINPVISGDGRYVAFESFATNLVALGDSNGSASDLFLRDVVAGTTTLISRSVLLAATGNLSSFGPSISNDGRFVAFESQASDLVPIGVDNNGSFRDVFVWDRLSGQNTLLSTAVGTNTSGSRESFDPRISDNGQWVAFVSDASNLVANDQNGQVLDVFARPTVGGATVLISVNRSGVSGNNSSQAPSISDDGRFVAFTSNANDLVGFIDINSLQDVYLRDRLAGTTLLASIATNGQSGNSASASPMVSGNGRFVAFTSAATNLIPVDINSAQDVFVRDTGTSATLLVSTPVSGNFGANNNSFTPVISDDGRYVAFASTASNLVTNDINFGTQDVFRRDLVANTTLLVSLNAAGTGSGNSGSLGPAISGNGQGIAFQSTAADLVFNDTNQFVPDVFALTSSNQIVVTGADRGGGPHVKVLDGRSLSERYGFFAYNAGFTGGVRVATADVNFDGVPDIITAAGPGGGPHVRVFNGAAPGQQLPGPIGSFFAYAAGFTGGVYVAAADLNGDGHADIITGADTGGGPHVRVFSGATGAVLFSFFAFNLNFTGGVRVGAADVDGDGVRDILTATGPGTGSLVRVFSVASGSLIRELSPYGAFPGGVYVSAGDVNLDGRADIITGAGSTGGPHVRVFDGQTSAVLASFFAFDLFFTGGVRVGSVDTNSDGRVEILAATGPTTQGNVRLFSLDSPGVINQAVPYPGFGGGVFVAGSVPGAVGGSPIIAPQGVAQSSVSAVDPGVQQALRSGEINRFAALAQANQDSADQLLTSLEPANRRRLDDLTAIDALFAQL